MEGIFYQDEEDDNSLVHCFIEELDLHSLPKLVGFLVHNGTTIDWAHDGTHQKLTNEVSPIKNNLIISHMEMFDAFSFKLTERWLQNLKRLKIAFCHAVEVVFLFEDDHVTTATFNSLKELELYGLRSLMHIWFSVPAEIIAFQNLQLLILSEYLNATMKRYKSGNFGGIPSDDHLNHANPSSINSSTGSSNYTYSEPSTMASQSSAAASEANGEENPNSQVKSSAISPNSPTPGSSDDSCSESSSTGISIPTSQYSITTSEANEEANLYGQILDGPNYMKEFTFADLKIATKNFSSDNLLGKGGFGGVYKGWLNEKTFAPSETCTGMAVAVKRYSPTSKQGFSEWQREVEVLERLSHPNLVKFIGCCSENRELLLVLEFIQMGSLFDHLHKRNSEIEPLSWDMRIKIAIGVARGLNFLHTLEKKVIHRDIKPSNILIDSNYSAKIIDFGLAIWKPSDGDSHLTTMSGNVKISDLDPSERLCPSESDEYSHISTMIVGTIDYKDPQYAMHGQVYVETDVYSFGIVLLELMTGLKVVDRNRPEGQVYLPDWFLPNGQLENMMDSTMEGQYSSKELEHMMDSTMEGQYSSKAMFLTAKLALKCIAVDRKKRPSMRQVIKELQKIYALKDIEDA
ncbi:Protein kinase superfamily protein [Euphorbia peplus]|nr:Protein kinase superfamily protein [Euphorbia peplus]